MHLLVISMASMGIVSNIQASSCNDADSIITLTADGKIYADSDLLLISISALSRANTTQEVSKQNNKKIKNIYSKLISLGLEKENIQTSSYSIAPIYSKKPENPPKDWKSKIISYSGTNTILIKTKKIELADKIINTAIKFGGDRVDFVNFELENQNKYKNMAIAKAIHNAKSLVKEITKQTDTKIVKIKSISLDNATVELPRSQNYLFSSVATTPNNSYKSLPVIYSKQIEVSASITVEYIIKQ